MYIGTQKAEKKPTMKNSDFAAGYGTIRLYNIYYARAKSRIRRHVKQCRTMNET
jgi:hypothetical protein